MKDEHKPNIPIRAGESDTKIPAASGSLLGSILSASDPGKALNTSISMSGHDNFNRALGIRSEADAAVALAGLKLKTQQTANAAPAKQASFARGETVYNTVGKPVVVIKAMADNSYEVVDKHGNSSIVKGKRLRRK